jgi:outer membrane protein insertion porin family
VDFTKYLVETRTYFRYGRFWRAPILALRVRGKWGEKLPLDEEFHIGGQNTLRGYEENQFRGSRTVLGTLEFRVPLTRDFLAYLFLDAGRVWEDPEMKEYKFGFGFGLRMSTPLGIIRLDYGIGEEGKPRIYFGMGDVF